MKLTIIYGPPASGKMTIAKELYNITEARFFPHNVIFDLINPLFGNPRENDWMWDLYEEIKLDIIKKAKEESVDLVLTEIFDKKFSNIRIKKFVNNLKKLNIDFSFVKITCNKEELLKRVENEDRKNTEKIASRDEYKKIIGKGDLDAVIPYVDNIIIDNTNLSPKDAAKKIKNKINLK